MSAFIFLGSLFGIRFGDGGEKVEMISYDSTKTVVTISLDENPSTGYSWQYVSSADGVVKLTADEYHSQAQPGISGAGGVRSFSFTAQQEGTVTLTFTYLRVWEGDPIRTVVICCSVNADGQVEATLLSDDA